ncbi:NAD(P)/FAD-dependent oxidoreductase [Klugiella xanthotipulae]|uniref:Putrescine oxidase n=1 Tax=Klugiella xanthotipulae TaxID=244735 RepID=A0A543HRU8_9MICO|nr:NAD(P)/FAD-dependent oxidoreductase [Klugiella xanthotipulae]TQM61050.1 putrescine oxidase [Klugiella xanthotipulae]
MTQEHITRDVAIIGAGASGLSAATTLRALGHSVIVLEARDRVGGRLWTNTINGAPLEIGGQWISPDQDVLKAVVADLGLSTYSRYREGENVYVAEDGTRTLFTGDIFPVGQKSEAEIIRLIALLDELAGEVGCESPWTHPRAEEFDAIAFTQWLAEQSDDRVAKDNVALFVGPAMLTKPAYSFSLLQALLMAASAGGFSSLVDADFMLDRRVVGGLQSVPLGLAARLGDDVRLNQPVRHVRDNGARVTVSTDDVEVTAHRVIVALPPNLVNRMSFAPALPRLRQQMLQHQSFGFVIKVHAVYSRPFWRDAGLSGTAFSPYQIVHEAYDNTWNVDADTQDTRGTLVGFVSDVHADRLFRFSAEERQHQILESLSAYYGAEAMTPEVYYESDWAAEEWTGGAYAASFDIGGLARYGRDLRVPVGNIRFASSDIAGHGYQHVDGALRIGRDTAQEVAASL